MSKQDEMLFENDDRDEHEEIDGVDEDPTCLILQLMQEERKEPYKPWKRSLIIKLLGKHGNEISQNANSKNVAFTRIF